MAGRLNAMRRGGNVTSLTNSLAALGNLLGCIERPEADATPNGASDGHAETVTVRPARNASRRWELCG